MYKTQDMVSLTNINSLNIDMMKITQAKRPKNSQMSKEKLEKAGINVPEWEDGLKRYLKEENII